MASLDLHDPQNYFNRELAWLSFNERVLEEAENSRNPLLERLKFLSIFSNNLDENIMIRYAGLKEQIAAGINKITFDGLSPQEQIDAYNARLKPMIKRHRKLLNQVVIPQLAKHGVHLMTMEELNPEELEAANRFFEQELFPVLTPLAVDSGHPFPRLPNLSFSMLLELYDPIEDLMKRAVVQVPNVVNRFYRLPKKGYYFISLEEIIKAKLHLLFPGYQVRQAYGFRITRNADIEIAEDEADDLLLVIEDEVRKRRWGDAVRLEVIEDMPQSWQRDLQKVLKLEDQDIYHIPRFLDANAFFELAFLPIPELRDPPLVSRLPSEYRNQSSIFEVVRKQDILIHHPFHDFASVQVLLDEAADDPDVLAIKQTLYRVGNKSPVVAALARAAGNGKLVTALVELKARFDEENNILWARELEQAGVHVVYGFAELKTHCKVLMIVRREGDEICRYVHLGTGNYNASTSSIYTDLALLTSDAKLGKDASELFNILTGFSKQNQWRKLWVAPSTLRRETMATIEREIAHAQNGKAAKILAKMNQLVDPEIIRALYRASQAGVEIDLIVRGICCLRPGVEGLSDNIRVRNIVGRFLEHSRIFYFYNDGQENLYLSSADWMQRNLNRRVETSFPIEDPKLKKKLMIIFDLLLRDNVQARELQSDGSYIKPKRKPGQRRLDSQQRLLELSARRLAEQ